MKHTTAGIRFSLPGSTCHLQATVRIDCVGVLLRQSALTANLTLFSTRLLTAFYQSSLPTTPSMYSMHNLHRQSQPSVLCNST